MSGHGIGHASHSSLLPNGHSTSGHTLGTPYSSANRNNPWRGAAASNWMLPSGHGAHEGQGGRGNSPSWSSTAFGFRQTDPRLVTSLAERTSHGRISAADHTSLPRHALSGGNGRDTPPSRVGYGIDDRAPVSLPRLQRTTSTSSLLPLLPSASYDGIRCDNHSAHQPLQGLTSDPSKGWAAKLRSRAQSDLSLPGSIGQRSRTRSDRTGVPPTSDWTLGSASGTRPVFRPSLDRYSAIELPATRGLEDVMAQPRMIATTQPTNRPSMQTGT